MLEVEVSKDSIEVVLLQGLQLHLLLWNTECLFCDWFKPISTWTFPSTTVAGGRRRRRHVAGGRGRHVTHGKNSRHVYSPRDKDNRHVHQRFGEYSRHVYNTRNKDSKHVQSSHDNDSKHVPSPRGEYNRHVQNIFTYHSLPSTRGVRRGYSQYYYETPAPALSHLSSDLHSDLSSDLVTSSLQIGRRRLDTERGQEPESEDHRVATSSSSFRLVNIGLRILTRLLRYLIQQIK